MAVDNAFLGVRQSLGRFSGSGVRRWIDRLQLSLGLGQRARAARQSLATLVDLGRGGAGFGGGGCDLGGEGLDRAFGGCSHGLGVGRGRLQPWQIMRGPRRLAL